MVCSSGQAGLWASPAGSPSWCGGQSEVHPGGVCMIHTGEQRLAIMLSSSVSWLKFKKGNLEKQGMRAKASTESLQEST